MDHEEFLAIASPPCHECGEPVIRVEIAHALTPGGEWVPDNPMMVCPNGHRVPVELLG